MPLQNTYKVGLLAWPAIKQSKKTPSTEWINGCNSANDDVGHHRQRSRYSNLAHSCEQNRVTIYLKAFCYVSIFLVSKFSLQTPGITFFALIFFVAALGVQCSLHHKCAQKKHTHVYACNSAIHSVGKKIMRLFRIQRKIHFFHIKGN